ncbi:predicted protein [Histoplasma mississippiense (nom. inval.)]|uniref:predicted protein n=1 Tax=Ajellomyces capsulatus (strain NAm1 / WU24) TaxID=2059318 RepID=UPI000157C0D7|nr:predicted protein [Histoplasma mississippiense (nom. inval.)]EDN06905.1 predicted protein [Histoplasma mississippiense (nom. inval.)]
MSLFGQQAAQQPQSTGLFGQQTGSLFGAPQQAKPLFGSLAQQQQQQPQQQTGSLFGASTQQQQQQPQQQPGSLFGGVQQNQQKPGGLFAGLGSNTQTQTQQGGNLFAGLGSTSTTQQPQSTGGGLFGGSSTQQQQPQQQPSGGSMFSAFGQNIQQQQPQTQQGSGLFAGVGASTQPPQQPFGATLSAGQQHQQPLGQSQQNGATLWTPGQGMTGGRQDDETKWEEALRKRPGPGYVPVLVQGFWELGKRAQRQRDFLAMMQVRLHEINNALTELLSRHDLKISVKIAACRRKHTVLSQRCLALAAKTQILRNRGYAMDETEEELQKKLHQLERSVFDPSLNGRTEEIWARMLAIREQSKRLQLEVEKTGQESNQQADDELDESALKTAKKILESYAAQIQHLNKELAAAQRDFETIHGSST